MLRCPFHDETKECGFTTTSDEEYLDHTQIHKPVAIEGGDRLWQLRLKMAKNYEDIENGINPKKTPLRS